MDNTMEKIAEIVYKHTGNFIPMSICENVAREIIEETDEG